MNRFGFFAIFFVVLLAHMIALKAQIQRVQTTKSTKTKITKITLSTIEVQKPTPPKPKVEPIILPPKPKHIEKDKKIKKRVTKKRKVAKKPKPKPKPKKFIKKEIIKTPTPIVSKIDTSAIKERYTSIIRGLIKESLYYPKVAKRMKIQGVVMVGFTVGKNGDISDIKIISGAKNVLKKGAIRTIKEISPPPIPSELGVESMTLSIPIEFKLKG